MNVTEGNLDESSVIKLIENFSYGKKRERHKIETREYTIREILNFLERGEWALPDLQRSFEWNDRRIKDLLDSLVRDYFIGTFLILDVYNKDKLYLGIRRIDGTNANLDNIRGLILDGQQRITSLYKAIKEPNKDGATKPSLYFYINLQALINYYNASSVGDTISDIVITDKKKLTDEESYENFYFPFYKIEDHDKWIEGLIEHFQNKNNITNKNNVTSVALFIQKLLDNFLNKTIQTVELPPDIDRDSLSEIFERINTKGLELNNFDLMVARLSKYDIKLIDELWKGKRDKIEEYVKDIFNKNFIETKLPLLIIQGMSLYRSKEADRNAILNLYDTEYLSKFNNPVEKFKNDWNIFVDKLIEGVNRMREVYYARPSYMPFNATLPVLMALLKKKDDIKNVRKEELDKKIDNWYWSAVLTNAYSKSSETQMARDIKEVENWFENNDEAPDVVKRARDDWESNEAMQHLKNDVTYKRQNSTFKAIICLIGLRGAKDYISRNDYGGRVNNDIDHIFPESKYRDNEYVDSILNLTLLSKNTNIYKRNKLPSEYINYFVSNYYSKSEEDFKEILKTHFINDEAYEAMKDDNFEAFLNARGKAILEAIREKITLPQSLTQSYNETKHDLTRPNKCNTI